MVNAPTIVSGEVISKLLCLKVDEKVTILGIIRGDVEEVFIREIRVDGWTSSVRGKRCNEFREHECFLAFGI
jgi:hypothetical protein